MLIGGKPIGNETKRSSKKQRSNAQKEETTNTTATAGNKTASAPLENLENNSQTEITNEKTDDKVTTTTQKPATSSIATTSTSSSATSTNASATKENNDPKSNNEQTTPQQAASTSSSNNEQASTSNGASASNAANNTNSIGINKKIPKHKWRPLQIDLAKTSRSKSIGRPTRRGFGTQQRYPERSNQRSGEQNERRSNNSATERNNNNGTERQEQRNVGNKKPSGPNERIDSWRSGSGPERSNDRDYERTARTQRRFRTSYRGGRQGRGGGFSRPGPGRTSNRIPRHMLANGEYANYLPADAAGTDQSFVLMGTHYYGPMPAAYIEMDAQSVKEAIKKQV